MYHAKRKIDHYRNMQPVTPPLPQSTRRSSSWRIRCLIALALVPAIIFGSVTSLRLLGLFRPFYIPVGSMAPALSKRDHVAMEGITFLLRYPRRGDVVVFNSDHIEFLAPQTFYTKRVVGVPGDHLTISNGDLFIDDKLVILSNNEGRIVYDAPPISGSFSLQTNVTVADDCYFLLGDNSTNSFDSRFIGAIPRKEIVGRIIFCYWPPSRIGIVR
ncbi:MAG TPA: signal peptidase I [Verrucomicrobiae bacterium]|nr:signal peptidase I [Verrucomicrobiae bacterium]